MPCGLFVVLFVCTMFVCEKWLRGSSLGGCLCLDLGFGMGSDVEYVEEAKVFETPCTLRCATCHAHVTSSVNVSRIRKRSRPGDICLVEIECARHRYLCFRLSHNCTRSDGILVYVAVGRSLCRQFMAHMQFVGIVAHLSQPSATAQFLSQQLQRRCRWLRPQLPLQRMHLSQTTRDGCRYN